MSKKIFVFTLVFTVCCLMATSVWAAKKVDLLSTNSASYIQKMNGNSDHGRSTMASVFGLVNGEKFTYKRQTVDFNSVSHDRYQQTYKGIPVWGHEVVVSRDHTDSVVKLDGAVLFDIPKDILNVPGTLNPEGALTKMKKIQQKKDLNAKWNFANETAGTFIYLDKKNKANLVYVVSFFADNEYGDPTRPVFFIDVKSGKVIDSFDNLQTGQGTGPGGNLKIGQYTYNDVGGTYPGFGVTVAGSTCTMNTTNVKTVDLNHGTSGSTAYSYTCYNNTHENINGGYCPMNDAQYFGQVIYDMYQNWYGLPVLPFQLTMKIHYSTNYENAFWDGSSMTFGDGYTTFHPLVCLDVSAHEVSHGFTENHSNLTYSGQSGGMNESFSDMAGEAAKYYMRGTNDFMCGYDIFKAAGQALRYLCNPPQDGASIDHVSEYYSGLDVHYSSGIYNKVFCLVAQSSGWTTRMAFDIFTKANTDYWTASETFVSGAEDVRQAALDYGYNCSAVAAAFANVGITITACPVNAPPVANFSGNPTTVLVGSTVAFTDLSTNTPTSWSWSFPGGTPSSSTVKNPTVTYSTIGTYDVSLTATNAYGSDGETKTAYITVANSIPDDIAEGLDYTGSTFTKTGNANWAKVTDVYYNGGDSAKSGVITHSQSCSIETSVTVTAAKTVKFYWQVSSEASYDYLRFYIDGVQMNQISGTTTWAQVSNSLAIGTHTLKWTYLKDSSVSSGSDCGWVDKLEIVTPTTDPLAEALDYPGLTFTLSGTGSWYSQTTTTYYGGDAAQSPVITHSQSSSMETTISGKTTVKFYWRVSSEASYDYLRFYIDGTLKNSISGSTSWAQKSYTVTTGSHVLKWTYSKDASVSSGSDCGWVDKLELL
jgi:Zn-dependent metalloprotease